MGNSSNADFSCAGCDTAPTLSNTIVLPLFFFLFSLAVPCITRDAINVRRALKLYDAQPTSPVPEPDVLTAEETRARSKANSGKQLANAAFGLLSYLSVLICGTFFGNPLTWEAVAQKSPSIILGVFLSHKRPFTIFEEGQRINYVRRIKHKSGAECTEIPQILVLTVEESQPSPVNRLVSKVVWPAALAFVTLETGIMIPFFSIVHHFVSRAVYTLQGGSLKTLVKVYCLVIAYIVCSVSIVIGLSIQSGGGPSERQDVIQIDPEFVNLVSGMLFSIITLATMVPVYHVLVRARNYDLQILERDGDLEAEIAVPRGNLIEVDSNTEEMTVPVLKLDQNGKRPVVLQGNFTVGKNLFAMYFSSGPGKNVLIERVPTLRLPTYSSAVIVLQTVALLTLMAVIMAPYDTFDQHNPDMAWLHPIALGDLFRPAVLKRMDAVAQLVDLSLTWTICMFVLLTITVLISVLWQHGWAGVKTIWTKEDRIWFEDSALSTVIQEPEGDEEKASPVATEPLLDIVFEK